MDVPSGNETHYLAVLMPSRDRSLPKNSASKSEQWCQKKPYVFFYGCRFTMLSAIWVFYKHGGPLTKTLCPSLRAVRAVYSVDEASFYCWDQRSRHSCLHLCYLFCLQLVGYPVDDMMTLSPAKWFIHARRKVESCSFTDLKIPNATIMQFVNWLEPQLPLILSSAHLVLHYSK